VRVNIVVKEAFFDIKIPLDIGITKCFSKICDDYKKIHDGDSSDLFDMSSLNSTALQATSDLLSATPIPAPIQQKIREIEQPFKLASLVSIVIFAFIAFISILSIAMTIYFFIKEKTSAYRGKGTFHGQAAMLFIVSVCYFAGILSYIGITYNHLGIDGYYTFNGVYLSLIMAMLNLLYGFICLVNKLTIKYSYRRIDEENGGMNVELNVTKQPFTTQKSYQN
jgi:hypothetical protein